MNSNIKVRKADQDDIGWVNQKYDEVKFKRSVLSNEFIAIAELNGVKAGIGRLQKIDENSAELGGMYVFPEFRRKGVADQIVRFLIENSNNYRCIFCLPFEYVAHFYRKFGFSEVTSTVALPQALKEKHRWCNTFYPDPTYLYYLDK